jgi:hypothetical protein
MPPALVRARRRSVRAASGAGRSRAPAAGRAAVEESQVAPPSKPSPPPNPPSTPLLPANPPPPPPKASYTTPRVADPKRLAAFRKLAGWGADGGAAKGQLPAMFFMAEGFRLVMSVLTLPAFPVSILGTVVNKRARYSLLRGVPEGERLLYRCGGGAGRGGGGGELRVWGRGCSLWRAAAERAAAAAPAGRRRAPPPSVADARRTALPRRARCALRRSARLVPAVRETFSGHAEFDIVLEAASAERSDVVWQAVLTLVLMNPKKSKGHGGGGKKVWGGGVGRRCRGRGRVRRSGGSGGGRARGGAPTPPPLASPPNAPQPEPEAPAPAEAIDAWSLPENAGRAYAALDGDISPMHLYK